MWKVEEKTFVRNVNRICPEVVRSEYASGMKVNMLECERFESIPCIYKQALLLSMT